MNSPYGKVKPSRAPKTPTKPYNRPKPSSPFIRQTIHNDTIIDNIINASDVFPIANEYKTQLYYTFLRGGLPTDAYKEFLVRVLERFNTFTPPQLQNISNCLMRFEEESLTGIMKIQPNEAVYSNYQSLLQAVFGDKFPFQNPDGSIDLANSTIVITISEIQKGCSYGQGCTRRNPLHRQLMHHTAGGKRRTRKHKTYRRSKGTRHNTSK